MATSQGLWNSHPRKSDSSPLLPESRTSLAAGGRRMTCSGKTSTHIPASGPGSLAFSYEAVPLTHLLLRDKKNLQEIDDFLRQGARILDPEWPWASAEEFRKRLAEAKKELVQKQVSRV